MQNDNTKNIIFASILSAVILISWTWFYEKPKLEAAKSLEQARQINSQSPTSSEQKSQDLSTNPNLLIQNPISAIQNTDKILPKEEIIGGLNAMLSEEDSFLKNLGLEKKDVFNELIKFMNLNLEG